VKFDKNIETKLSTAISNFFNFKISQAPEKRTSELIEQLKILILRGGKRSRPKLFYLTLFGYSEDDKLRYLDVALALELYHQFLLIHDDIIDKDYERYSGPNISGYYKQEFYDKDRLIPDSLALLAGDLIFSYVYEVISSSNQLTNQQKISIINLFNKTNELVLFGQQLDTLNTKLLGSQITVETLLEIHKHKTASYTVSLPMKLATILTKLDKSEIEKIDRFSQDFGIYYQLADDYSDYFENNSVLNKGKKYRDFTEGKLTIPIIYFLDNMTGKDKKYVEEGFGNKNLTTKQIKKSIDLIEKSGAKRHAKKLCQKYYELALQALGQLNLKNKYSKKFFDLIAEFQL